MTQKITLPKAVFFDWDGTLVDSFAFLHGAHNHVRSIFGMDTFSSEVFAEYFGQPREKLYAELYESHKEEAKEHFVEYVTKHHLDDLKPTNGAENLLKALKAAHITCGVVTNKKRNLVEAEITNFGWDHYFSATVGAGDAAADKPSSAPLHMAIEHAQVQAKSSDIWFVGDTDNDVLCANEAECLCVLILDDPKETAHLKSTYHIDIHTNNCQELADLVLQLNTK